MNKMADDWLAEKGIIGSKKSNTLDILIFENPSIKTHTSLNA